MNMKYKSNDINDLSQELKEGVVTFEYKKKDGSVRTAQGTLNDEYLQEKIPDKVYLEVIVISTLMREKNIPTMKEYAQENGLEYLYTEIHDDKMCYVFEPIKKEKKVNENVMTYYDVEKDAFRSFNKENFLGIL